MDLRRYDDLLQRWQDGDASDAELQELETLLKANPELRRDLVSSVLLDLELFRKYAPAKAQQPARRWRWEVVAAAIIFAVSAALVARVLLFRGETTGTPATGQKVSPHVTPKKKTPVRTTPEAAAAVRLLERATFDLAGALDRAVAAGGGIPVKAELEEENGRAIYSVDLAVDGKTRSIDFDIRTGAVVPDDEDDEDDDAAKHVKIADLLQVPLKTAISKALAVVPGKAVEAETELKDGMVRIEVKILADGAFHKVVVDGQTGGILKK